MTSSQQYVSLVAQGGTPIRIADQRGTPYPTTGQGSLVFSNGPILDNATLNDPTIVNSIVGPYKNILDFNRLANTGDADAGTEAWADLLAYCNDHEVAGYLPAGLYVINTAPGTILNPAEHNCPQVDYNYINIVGAGQEVVTIRCVPRPTPVRPTVNTSKPLLLAVASDRASSLFSLKGVTLDGGISVAPSSLATGADPDSSALLEVRNYGNVDIEVGLTKFAQNYDTSDPDNGNFGRRGPMLIWDNDRIDVQYKLSAPTFREGPFFGNNVYTKITPIYRGPENNLNGDSVSTPLNCFSRSADPAIGGEFLLINRPDFTGCWRGSAGNFYIPGDIRFEGGPILRGSITTVNTTTGSANTTGDAYNWGKGWDFGAEIAIGPTRSIYVLDGHVEELMTYSWKFTRTADTRIGSLTGNASAHNCFDGLQLYYVDHVDFSFKASKILWYYPPTTSSGGVAARVSNCDKGTLHVDIDGTGTAIYNFPNATVPSTGDIPRISRLGVWKTKSQGVIISGVIKDCAAQLIYEDVDDVADSGAYDAIWADLAFYTDVYPTSNTIYTLIRVGSGSSLAMRSLWQKNCSFNGLPLILSDQITGLPTQPVDGLQRIILGNMGDTLAQGEELGRLDFFNGDGSTGNRGVRGRITSRTVDSIGRGASIGFETSPNASDPALRFQVNGDGTVNFVPMVVPASSDEGDTYYDSTFKNLGVWNGTSFQWAGINSVTVANSGTHTPNVNLGGYAITNLGGAIIFAAPTGVPVNFLPLMIRIKDNGSSRTITWNAVYRASGSGPALPATTTAGKTMYLSFVFNSTDNTWDLLSLTDNF